MFVTVLTNTERRKCLETLYIEELIFLSQLILLIKVGTKSPTVIFKSQQEKKLILRAENN